MSGFDEVPVIRSAQNSKVKRVRAVRAGKEEGVVLLEGLRLVRDAVAGGVALEALLIAEQLFHVERDLMDVAQGARLPVEFVDAELLQRVSGLKSGVEVLAIAREPEVRPVGELGDALAADALVLVVDGVQDPANLGALVRSAEAAGVAAVVHVAGGAGIFHPRTLRGSMGSALRVAVFAASDAPSALEAVRAAGLRVLRPDTRGGTDWRTVEWSGRVALWIGGEAGAAGEVEGQGVTIPMGGAVESLNVTVAASLLLFAAGRVR